MREETLNLIHRMYQQSLETSSNLMEIAENLYRFLNEIEVGDEDEEAFDAFIDGLKSCIHSRQKTFEITNFMSYVIITMMYIILWLNKTRNMNLDVIWYARRKSLESELTKMLRKSSSALSVNVRDLFGLRCIILNDVSEKVAKGYVYSIYEAIVGIVTGKNRKMRKDFCDWIQDETDINLIDKSTVQFVMSVPFKIDFIKDYIKDPKGNNYQTLQFTISVPVYSKVLPGCQMEIQLRSAEMHEIATKGSASHLKYKETGGANEAEMSEKDKAINKVFVADDFSKIHIVGFSSYKSKEDDIDGIHFEKEFADRRISTTLVP